MKKLRLGRGLLITAGLVLLLAVVGVLGPYLVPGQQLAAALTRNLGVRTGADIGVGSASFRLWPRPRVRLADGRLLRSGTDQGQDLEVHWSQLDLQLSWRTLLRRIPEVSSFTLRGESLATRIGGRPLVLADFLLAGTGLRPPEGGTERGGLPLDLVLGFELEAGRVAWGDAEFSAAEAAGRLAGGTFRLDRFEAAVGGGRFEGRAILDYSADPRGRLEFFAACQGVAASALLDPWAGDLRGKLEGTLDGEAAGACRLDCPDTARATLELEGRLKGIDGVLHAADWLQEATPYLGARQDLKDIRFAELNHVFHLHRGLYLIDLEVAGPDTQWRGTGWIGLDGALDLGLKVILPPGFTPELGQWSFIADSLRDDQGRVKLAFGLRGPAASPSFVLDLGGILGGAAGQDPPPVEKGWAGLLDKWRSG